MKAPKTEVVPQLPPATRAKIAQCIDRVKEIKQDLATALVQFEMLKASALQALAEQDARASALANEAAEDMRLDPKVYGLDWNTLTIIKRV